MVLRQEGEEDGCGARGKVVEESGEEGAECEGEEGWEEGCVGEG